MKREPSPAEREAAIRILGASDGYAHLLIRIRSQIGNINSSRIDPRHVRKLAERDALLRPLVTLAQFCEIKHRECLDAYKKRMAGEVV